MSPKPIAFRRRHRVSRLSAAVLAAFSIALLASSPGLAAAGADSSLSARPSGKSSRRWPYKTGAAEPVRDEVHTRSVSSRPVHQSLVVKPGQGSVSPLPGDGPGTTLRRGSPGSLQRLAAAGYPIPTTASHRLTVGKPPACDIRSAVDVP